MDPINYLMNVPNPGAAAFEGYNQGIQRVGEQQRQEIAGQQEARAAEMQPYKIQQAQQGLEINDLNMQNTRQQMAIRQRQAERAQAFQDAATGLAQLGPEMTIADIQNVVTQFPEFGDSVLNSYQALNEAQQNSVAGVLGQSAYALKNGDVETGLELMDAYVAAAEKSGNAELAATAQAIRQTAEINPDAALMDMGLALQIIAPDVASQIFQPEAEEPAAYRALKMQALAGGLVEGTPEFQNFMRQGGAGPANFLALDRQAKAAGLVEGTPEYQNFMATRGAGEQAYASTTGANVADIETGGEAARVVAEGRAQGAADVASQSEVAEMQRNLPGLQTVVDQLYDLSNTATFTRAGRLRDDARRALGLPAGQGAIDRAAYIAIVDNQILPLLRQTFGAAFTAKEGETLRATLGDPNASPEEKHAKLEAFIAQKERDLAARLGGSASTQPAPPASTPAPPSATPSYMQFGGN